MQYLGKADISSCSSSPRVKDKTINSNCEGFSSFLPQERKIDPFQLKRRPRGWLKLRSCREIPSTEVWHRVKSGILCRFHPRLLRPTLARRFKMKFHIFERSRLPLLHAPLRVHNTTYELPASIAVAHRYRTYSFGDGSAFKHRSAEIGAG